jgi:ankyrin repeat protein
MFSLQEIQKIINQQNADDRGKTAANGIYHAACKIPEQVNRIKVFLEYSADLNAINKNVQQFNNTPLHLLIANEDYAGCEHLISLTKKCNRLLDYNITDIEGKTPLLLATKIVTKMLTLTFFHNIRTQYYQVDKSIEPDPRPKKERAGVTLLESCKTGQDHCLKLMLQNGVNAEFLFRHYASHGEPEKVKEILFNQHNVIHKTGSTLIRLFIWPVASITHK